MFVRPCKINHFYIQGFQKPNKRFLKIIQPVMAVEKNCWERAATQKADFQRQNKDLSRRSKLKITLRSLAVNKWTSFQLIYYFLVSLFVQWHTWLRKISRNDIDAIFTVIQFAWSWPKFTCFEKKYKQFHTHTHTHKKGNELSSWKWSCIYYKCYLKEQEEENSYHEVSV